MNAMITAIGSLSADIIIKNLRSMKYSLIGCDIYPREWICDAYNVDFFYQVPYASDEKYIDFIQGVAKKHNVKYILPLTDVELDVLNINRKWFEKNDICLCISSSETLGICRNKKKLEEFISSSLDVNTIPTALLIDSEGYPEKFPVIGKPLDGRSSQGLKLVHDPDEWDGFVRNVDKRRYIVQPYIRGSIVTVDVVRQKDGKKIVAIARKELLRTPNGAGTSVYVFKDRSIENQCKQIADELNIIGCVNFEFICDESGTYHFMECNPRFSGGVEFSCMAGYDCVKNHIRSYASEEIEDFELPCNMYIARKYEEYITKTIEIGP